VFLLIFVACMNLLSLCPLDLKLWTQLIISSHDVKGHCMIWLTSENHGANLGQKNEVYRSLTPIKEGLTHFPLHVVFFVLVACVSQQLQSHHSIHFSTSW
jgi:hypothetical protein